MNGGFPALILSTRMSQSGRLRKLGLIARLDYLESKAMLYAAAAEAAVLTVAHVDERGRLMQLATVESLSMMRVAHSSWIQSTGGS